MKTIFSWVLLGLMFLGSFSSGSRAAEDRRPAADGNDAVDIRYNFGGFREPGTWYKGNLHLHSTISDGNLDPLATVEVYRRSGYHFTALTDHIGGFWDKEKKEFRPLVYPLEQMNTSDFLVLPAIEYNTNRNDEVLHFVAVGPGYDLRLEEGQDLSEAMKKWWDNGAFAFMAHPHWSLDGTDTLEAMSFLPAVEIFNYATSMDEGIRGNSQMYWDRLLMKNRAVLGVANDDSHRPGQDSGGGCVMVKAKALTAESIITALRKGQFYSSSGPVLDDVYSDIKGSLHVRCSPVKFIRALSTVGRVAQVAAHRGETINKAVLKWDWSKSPFVRIECVDEFGRTAWSQGVLRIDEKEKTKKVEQ